jgi:acyl-CoA synthetase (AMP-forming)/AMP-acid ligase II
VIGDSRPRLLIDMRGGDEDGRDQRLWELRDGSPSIVNVVTRPRAVRGLSTSLDDFLAAGPGPRDPAPVGGPDDPCAIVYTSGSTGAPKGALLSQAAMIRSAVISWEHWYGALTPQRTVVQHPINHVGWLVCECISTLVPGGTMFFQERFSGAETLRLVERERLNLWVAFPSMLMLAMDTPEFRSCDLSSLRTVALGMSATVDVMRAFQSRTGAAMRVSYGLTEASGGAVTATGPDDALEVVATGIGRPLPGVGVRLAADGGEPPAPGQPGELLVRDRCLFLGYLNRPDATAAALDGAGWLHTGDIAVADGAGGLRLVGRRHEMFKSGGYNVYPTEVETVVGRHPAVSAAAVVEVADELWGEVGVAFVVPRPGGRVDEVELRAFALEQLANYKVPKRFVLLDALPELPNGKFDRVRLRAEARSMRSRTRC